MRLSSAAIMRRYWARSGTDSRAPAGESNRYTRATDGPDSGVNVPIAGRYGITQAVSSVAVIVTAIAGASPEAGYVVVAPHAGAVPETDGCSVRSRRRRCDAPSATSGPSK